MRNEISFRGQSLQFATKADFIYHMGPCRPYQIDKLLAIARDKGVQCRDRPSDCQWREQPAS
jgi:hypothetical protein